MQIHLKTQFGDSETFYGNDPLHSFQGSCQGNGASPAIWLVVCLFLLKLLKRREQLSMMSSAITGEVINVIGLAYVDDADLVQMSGDKSIDSLLQRTQSTL